MTPAKTPVFLLTGFLGSGKTTLLNAALRAPRLAHTAVVVNELGEIGLDNLIIAQAVDNVVLLDAGCLCCANTGALHETLADLAGRRARGEIPAFERVIIETSGVADPAPLLWISSGPSRLMLPAITAEPTRLATWRLSPVITASSVWDKPSITTPSTRTRSPGLTRTSIPAPMSRTGRRDSVPSSTTVAHSLSAAKRGSRSRAALARPAASI